MKRLLLTLGSAVVCSFAWAQPTTVTFNYTGSLQTFVVPACVTSVTIEARGAQGGAVTGYSPFPQGGLGATMIGDFSVTPGDTLKIVVGARGNSDPSSSGGGGGSGVNLMGSALIVAGGGAGVDFQDPTYSGQHAVTTANGVTGSGTGGAGGVSGGSGGDWTYSGSNTSRGGNGWNAGNTGSTGLNGVSTNTTTTNGTWGLGGGGGSVGYGWCNCGGGGGGYSGGGSGNINATGGGGGSYNTGTNQVNTAGNNSGNGVVMITYTISGSTPASPTSISGSSSVCVGSGAQTYSIAAVAGATGYTWSVPAGSSIQSGQGTTSISLLPGSTSGTISVTADNSCGSSAPTNFTLTINANPAVALGADVTQCGGMITLDAQNAGSTYLWSDASTNQTLSVSASGTYDVTVTDANGCTGADTISVTINTPPNVALGADIAQCGGTVTLDAQNAGSMYMWSDSSTNQTLTVSATGTYYVTVTDANSCTGSDTISVAINIPPTVALGADVTQCGGSITLDAQNAGSTYLWSDASTNQMLTVTMSGVYSVVVTDANGCTATDTMMATINPLPTVNLGSDITQCGGTVTLDAQNAGSTYMWSDSSSNQTLSVSSGGNYSVTVTDGNGCSASDTIMVTINPLPNVTGSAPATICLNDAPASLSGSPAGGTWSGPGVTGSTFDPMVATTGTHQLVYSYTDSSSCTASDTVTIVVNGCVGIASQSSDINFSVTPNPNMGTFNIVFGTACDRALIEVVDVTGRTVQSVMVPVVSAGNTTSMNCVELPSGTYFVRVTAGEVSAMQKIVIVK